MEGLVTLPLGARKPAKSEVGLSARAEERLVEIKNLYPKKESAIMPALYIAQEELGWISGEAIVWVSDRLQIPPAHVMSVASFYTMFYKQPVGKYHIQVCRTLSCMLCGAKEITKAIKERLKIHASEISENGVWSFEEVECLGSCGTAPMVQINDVFFENLTTASLNTLMDRIENEKPDLRYSTIRGDFGGVLKDIPMSQVWKK